jgi:hypothetical protein
LHSAGATSATYAIEQFDVVNSTASGAASGSRIELPPFQKRPFGIGQGHRSRRAALALGRVRVGHGAARAHEFDSLLIDSVRLYPEGAQCQNDACRHPLARNDLGDGDAIVESREDAGIALALRSFGLMDSSNSSALRLHHAQTIDFEKQLAIRASASTELLGPPYDSAWAHAKEFGGTVLVDDASYNCFGARFVICLSCRRGSACGSSRSISHVSVGESVAYDALMRSAMRVWYMPRHRHLIHARHILGG